MLNLVYHDTQDERVYAALSQRMKDRYDVFGSLPDTIDDDWIENVERLEEMMDRYMHLRRQARDAFEIRYERRGRSGQRPLGALFARACASGYCREDVLAVANVENRER